ncbi:hypothetical protein [Rufibacter roseus]|uniref:DUF3575 domain-containing protein n=1 Tax=Rufibacter roseus TaxID=1567108 RepID=A0ABW2DND4_9BACT|nr:hypothetical protein [Rufibacter roseus]
MFKSFLFCLFSAALLHASVSAKAQSDSLPSGKYLFRISPQHLLLQGYHLDIEKQLKAGGTQSILFSPRVYTGNTHFADEFTVRSYRKEASGRVTGFGAEVQHRFYQSNLADLYDHNFYMAYGFNLHRFDIVFQNYGWAEELADDGLYYYRFKYADFQETIYRMGAMAYLGYQGGFITDRTLVDLYVCFGYNHSFSSTSYHMIRYNRNIMDYGHTGFIVYPGIKFGFVL